MTTRFVAVVKADCPTCVLVDEVLGRLDGTVDLEVRTQDDVAFPRSVDAVDDTDLDFSYHHDIDTVPTLLRFEGDDETGRCVGWNADEWRELSAVPDLGIDGIDFRPGCGSLSVDPDRVDELRARFESHRLISRRVDIETADEVEALFDRGWTDGLPVVPPTPARVLRMLEATTLDPQDPVAIIPPDLVEATVEKVAVNAVMAGCRPEYLPTVIAAVEAACNDDFNMHGLLATTWFAGPMVVVSGPVAQRIGMNSGVNALGQGNRANATIGRALQLIVRNVGGGRPGEVDRATLGNPGKYSFCFAESPRPREWDWPTQAEEHGLDPRDSAVTLFAAEGVHGMIDQISRKPESLTRHFAEMLRNVASPKLPIAFDAALVISPEHLRVFVDAGWSKQRFRDELGDLLVMESDSFVRGSHGIDEGLPDDFAGMSLPKFREGGLLIFHAGGQAGMFSAVIGGWAAGTMGSAPVSRRIGT